MIRSLLLSILLIIPVSVAAAEDPCLACHQEKTPAAVAQWRQSAHAGAAVGCAACHGNDHESMLSGSAPVPASVCGRCHESALAQHRQSRHGLGLHSGWGCTRNLPTRDPGECRFCHEEGSTKPLSTVQCARFLKQSAAMREIGCNRCHRVESSCAGCHTGHMTDLAIVRDPNVCAKCHMGPDHPQWEMWETSQHGTLYRSAGGAIAPDCQRCHMPGGSHDVSRGITATPGGDPFPEPLRGERRGQMLEACNACHAPGFSRRELERGDAIRSESSALTKEADAIVWDLADRDLLDPRPQERLPHPFSGGRLVTDSQMLYEDTSHIERLLFKMKKYDLAKAVKGAYHQNPAYAHWYGNAELKMDLIDIRAEASRLRQRAIATPTVVPDSNREVETELRVLKEKFERGALSAEEYARQKSQVLKRLP